MASWDDEFVAYVAARRAALRRTAYLLSGDWHRAEDLVQAALARLYVRWPSVQRRAAVDAYARQVLLRLYLDERRLRSSDEVPVADPEPTAASPDPAPPATDRLDLMAALSRLTARQRAVLVLRFWEDLPVDAVSRVLELPSGTVKSLSSRGLDALRHDLALEGALVDAKEDD
jgi:RNA polymerase sigma-70 factor (sigma-E family)